jgi:hypothetical protein
MTAFTVILKTLSTLSSAIGFFLEDGPTADSALLHSVLSERIDLKDMWPLRTKKIRYLNVQKGFY